MEFCWKRELYTFPYEGEGEIEYTGKEAVLCYG